MVELNEAGEVRAAGGVVWRERDGVDEVLLVHRPGQRDWTFPKGKADAGESDASCALREVQEETGLTCELGDEVPAVRYVDGQGRPKVARYWLMRPRHGEFSPNKEVDEVEWLPVAAAVKRLTYSHDRSLLESIQHRLREAGGLGLGLGLSDRIETNVSAFLLAMGEAGGGRQRADEEVTWTVGGSPIGYHNAVVRCSAGSADAASRLAEQWRSELDDRGLPGSWHLAPSMRPAGLAEVLTDTGFEDGGDEPAMAADLTAALAPGLRPASAPTARAAPVEVRPARDQPSLEHFRDILASGFGEGPKEADWVAEVFGRIGLAAADNPWRHYLAFSDGAAVGTASLFLTPATAGIYFVATRPECRGRGIATAVTRHVMGEGRRLGASHAVLGSSPMAHRMYERLGFREVFRYRLFEREP